MDQPAEPGLSRSFGAWLVEVARTWPGLLTAYGPLPAVSRRRRQHALVAFAAASGAPRVARAHATWSATLGPAGTDTVTEAIVAYAVDAGVAGPRSTLALRASLSPVAAEAVRAAVAVAGLTAAIDRAADDLAARARGRRPRSLTAMVADLATMAAGAPLVPPFLGWAVAGAALGRGAPKLPEVDIDHADDASLLAHVVAEALPIYLGGAITRAAVVHSPMPLAVAVRSGGHEVTVRLGRGAITVADGLAPDVLAVIDGEIDGLLETVGDTIATELALVPEPDGRNR